MQNCFFVSCIFILLSWEEAPVVLIYSDSLFFSHTHYIINKSITSYSYIFKYKKKLYTHKRKKIEDFCGRDAAIRPCQSSSCAVYWTTVYEFSPTSEVSSSVSIVAWNQIHVICCLFWFHQAVIRTVKHLIQGRYNMARVRFASETLRSWSLQYWHH